MSTRTKPRKGGGKPATGLILVARVGDVTSLPPELRCSLDDCRECKSPVWISAAALALCRRARVRPYPVCNRCLDPRSPRP